MPSAAARRIYEDQIPSFMTVFDLDADVMADRETVTLVNPKLVQIESKAHGMSSSHRRPEMRHGCISSDSTHKHHDSTSTQISESAESSPTTTLSTTDSSPLSDSSPSSSPDSPLSLIPLNNFPSTSFGFQAAGNSTLLSISEGNTFARPMTSPAPRRPRNMKGLSIQPPVTALSNPVVAEPSSPSFIKPKIAAMKRKPSLLSLKTNTTDLIKTTSMEVPPSPGMPPILQRRALKHSTSSPHMLTSLKTSTFGPPGGMSFPKMLERNESGLSEVLRPMKSSMKATFDITIAEEVSPIKTQLANRSDYQPSHENVNNEDQKSPGYPEGPIAIYGDNVFLYLEPNAEEASRFDVVFNVAREVKNPFGALQRESSNQHQHTQPTPPEQSPIPETGVSTASFATAWEFQPSDDRSMETPTTPKANPFKIPEYIHVPWDHNTDISPDLLHLCETIDNRTKEGKRVLIHCQQGASRSASLIIAYGLFQNPELSVNDAYYAAQAKSRWISPNMKLMYSLQDFHKELSKKRTSPTSGAYRPRTGRSPTKHRLTLSADAIEMSSKEPHTAPLPDENGGTDEEEARRRSPTSRLRGNTTLGLPSISPGPASAPLTFSWRENLGPPQTTLNEPDSNLPEEMKTEPTLPEQTLLIPRLEEPAPFSLPAAPPRPKSGHSMAGFSHTAGAGSLMSPPSFLEQRPHSSSGFRISELNFFKQRTPREFPRLRAPVNRAVTIGSAYPNDNALMSPRAETMTSNPLREFPEVVGMRFVECPPPPAEDLFSPQQTGFPRDSYFHFGRPTQISDPRSPPTKGEAPIVRSIDDIL